MQAITLISMMIIHVGCERLIPRQAFAMVSSLFLLLFVVQSNKKCIHRKVIELGEMIQMIVPTSKSGLASLVN